MSRQDIFLALIILGTCSISVLGLSEGDMMLTPGQQATIEINSNPSDPFAPQNAVTNNRRSLWPNGQVPYVFNNLNSDAINATRAAIMDFTRLTCIRFVKRTTEEDYVRFFQGDGCYSYIGRIKGPQDISIGKGCEYKGTVIHEIFHALGRWHEQSRPDRDMFVRIMTQNIMSGRENNFEITTPSLVTTQAVPYDLGSVMHYGATAFSKNGDPTIVPVESSIPLSSLGQRNGLSGTDIQHVKTLYCSGNGGSSASWSSWSSWTTCTQTCNGGSRSRTRRCVGGTTCAGSNINMDMCNRESCQVPATWGQWSAWGVCSNTCGGGRQRRSRSCVGGMSCQGMRNIFRDCNEQSCPQPAAWASWGSWSSCSKTCMGGIRSRSRMCRNGNTCPGASMVNQWCNRNVACETQPINNQWSTWSECSMQCGGGVRFRVRMCSSSNCPTQRQSCNTQECKPEPQLLGIYHRGCWYWNTKHNIIGSVEQIASQLTDEPTTRTDPVRKCGIAVLSLGYRVFALTAGGYCISGSNRLPLYQYSRSQLCVNGKGGYNYNIESFVLDVYVITNRQMFDNSAAEIANGNSIETEMTSMNAAVANSTALLGGQNPNALNHGSVLNYGGMFACVMCWMCLLIV